MNQFTFWDANDTGRHITLAFGSDGYVWHLTRDEIKSVAPTWSLVGRMWERSGQAQIRFDAYVPHLEIAGTQLARRGWSVRGVKVELETQVSSRRTDKVTDPETLMGQGRKRKLDRGDASKTEKGVRRFGGTRFKVDVHAMHKAIQ